MTESRPNWKQTGTAPEPGLSATRITCDRSRQDEIMAMFNESIANTTALWDYEPRTRAAMDRWFDDKEAGGFPVLGLIDDGGKLLAFGSYGRFRSWAAYKYTVEHSLYVHSEHRGQGLGETLLHLLIAAAEEQGYHNMIGGIAAENAASIALHCKCGFTHAGTIRHAGFKFGRWIDLSFYQRILKGPTTPTDGGAGPSRVHAF